MPTTLDDRRLNRTTLLRQRLLERATATSVADLVRDLAGLQAQYSPSPYVALWSRLDGFAVADLETALADRSIVKATLMRSTLHLVAASDYGTFESAITEARTAGWRATVRRAGIDDVDLHRRLVEYAATPRTLAALEGLIDGIAPDETLRDAAPGGLRHVGFRIASARGGLVHAPPSGRWHEFGKPSYIAAEAWLGAIERPPPEVALAETVRRYLGAYGPASVEDVGRWLGERRLPRLRKAVERLGDDLARSESADGRELVDLASAPVADGDEPAPPRFLARWDSVLIGYDVRDRILPPALAPVIITNNADVLPTFLVDGTVAGRWSTRPTDGGKTAILEIEPLVAVKARQRTALEREAERLVRFIEPEAARWEVRWAKS